MIVKTTLVFIIILLIIVAYGAFYKGFGERHFDLIKRYFPSFLIWPKTQREYVELFKIGVIILLFIGIVTTIVVFFIEK